MYHVLYNPMSAGGGTEKVLALKEKLEDAELQDVTAIDDLCGYLAGLPEGDKVVAAGGDGTLNHFVNQLGDGEPARELFYYPVGSGNDFALDNGVTPETELIPLNELIKNLPTVEFDGITRRFVNGVGYGLDGYVCEECARIRKRTNRPVNYTAVALKALAYAYKPGNARVTVDGVTRTYERVWLAPTMYGRYFGGGMMIAPAQNRRNAEKTLSVVVVHGCGRLKILTLFPSIFKGGHIKYTDVVEVLTGSDITVEFDKSTAMQIDGETVPGATSCHSVSK